MGKNRQPPARPLAISGRLLNITQAASAASIKEIIMRTTVIIAKRGEGYISTVAGKFGGGHQGARCGLTPYDAAAAAARHMIEYAQNNPDGGDLMAPTEVLELVPEHLRAIKAARDGQ